MLVNSLDILKDAKKHGYAIPSPDFFDQNSLRAYVEVAEELQKPIIIAHRSSPFRQILCPSGLCPSGFACRSWLLITVY